PASLSFEVSILSLTCRLCSVALRSEPPTAPGSRSNSQVRTRLPNPMPRSVTSFLRLCETREARPWAVAKSGWPEPSESAPVAARQGSCGCDARRQHRVVSRRTGDRDVREAVEDGRVLEVAEPDLVPRRRRDVEPDRHAVDSQRRVRELHVEEAEVTAARKV